MPQVEITIGGRSFEVACQDGEEPYLRGAAQMLDAEASVLSDQIGRVPEARMLLMAGLMLADKTSGVEDRLASVQAELDEALARLAELEARAEAEPRTVEVPVEVGVPVLPEGLAERLSRLAERAEAAAERAEAG